LSLPPLAGRTDLAWLGRNRRLGYDHEATVTSSQTFVHAAVTAFMLRRLHPNV